MNFMDWLFEKTPDETVPPPPVQVPIAALPDGATDDRHPFGSPSHTVQLDNVLCVIDYRDANANVTRRRVTLLSVAEVGHWKYVKAVCHERQAFRTFRADRILHFIDPKTGEVSEVDTYFRDFLGVDLNGLADLAGLSFDPLLPARDEAGKIRAALRPDISLLVAVARADEHLDHRELDEICRYAVEETRQLQAETGLNPKIPNDVIKTLPRVIAAMRPQVSALPKYFRIIASYQTERMNRFFEALENVIHADGVVVPAEIELLQGIGFEVFEKTEGAEK
ncbi:WYL domain-containing protein [Seohaeicola nanhaiensis]|uniref:WYL domain-containing protein n=1 Tax=Seohaeicola nanhaiensis TaxID=1387282 RepID=A0ABV9KDY1_9RHOB